MADKRVRYAPSVRQRAYEMAVYEGYEDIADISRELSVNESTLRRWRSEDNWTDAKEEGTTASFVNIRNNLMLVIHRFSQRLVESMMCADIGALPDENIELRIDRLTRSLERTAPLGTFLLTKQRLDVVAEIQQACIEAMEVGTMTEDEIHHAFKMLKMYATTVKNSQRKGERLAV